MAIPDGPNLTMQKIKEKAKTLLQNAGDKFELKGDSGKIYGMVRI